MKKIISLLMLTLMLITLIPAAAYGGGYSAIVTYASIPLISGEYYVVNEGGDGLATVTDADSASCWYVDIEKTLYLRDFNIDVYGESGFIFSTDTTIKITGSNSMTYKAAGNSYNAFYGFDCSLTFEGTEGSSLKILGKSNDRDLIGALYNLYINDCDIELSSTTDAGLCCSNEMKLNNSKIRISSSGFGIRAIHNLSVKDSCMEIKDINYDGIISENSTNIQNTTATITEVDQDAFHVYNELNIEDSTIDISRSRFGLQSALNNFSNVKMNIGTFFMGTYVATMNLYNCDIYAYDSGINPDDVSVNFQVFYDFVATNSNLTLKTADTSGTDSYSCNILSLGTVCINGGSITATHGNSAESYGIIAIGGMNILDNYEITGAKAYYSSLTSLKNPLESTDEFINGTTVWIRGENNRPVYIGPKAIVVEDDAPRVAPEEKTVPTVYIGEDKQEIKILTLENYYQNEEKSFLAMSPIIIEDNRTFLGIRDMATVLGVDPMAIKWNDKTKTATITKSGATIAVTQGSKDISFTYGGFIYTIHNDVSAINRNDRIYLPFRIIFELFGYTVNWDNETRTITCK